MINTECSFWEWWWTRCFSRWWFQICFSFIPTWGRFPFWLISFKRVETTNQFCFDWMYCYILFVSDGLAAAASPQPSVVHWCSLQNIFTYTCSCLRTVHLKLTLKKSTIYPNFLSASSLSILSRFSVAPEVQSFGHQTDQKRCLVWQSLGIYE